MNATPSQKSKFDLQSVWFALTLAALIASFVTRYKNQPMPVDLIVPMLGASIAVIVFRIRRHRKAQSEEAAQRQTPS